MAPGFLAVFSEPGEEVSIGEFQDWYDNEHVPLRLNHLSSFLSGARFSAIDSRSPAWLALYEVDDTLAFQHESYTRLRTNRSDREKDLIGRLEVLDRRTCAVLSDTGEGKDTDAKRRTGLKAEKPSEVVVTYDIQAGEEGDQAQLLVENWFLRMVDNVKVLDGWARSRLVEVIDSGKTGLKVLQDESVVVPRYLGIHEFTAPVGISEVERRTQGSGGDGIIKLAGFRQWGLYRAYPSLAQGNLTVE